jgi:hypothetical protein
MAMPAATGIEGMTSRLSTAVTASKSRFVSGIPSTRNVRIDPDALHRREVHDDAPLDNRVARDRVPSAAHRHLEVVLSREVHRGDDVGHARAARDQGRPPVDHAAEHGARYVVAVVPRPQQLAAEARPELLEDRLVEPVAPGRVSSVIPWSAITPPLSGARPATGPT